MVVVGPPRPKDRGGHKPPSPRRSPLSLGPKNGFKGPAKHHKPNRGPLERVRAPDQQPTEPFVYMGPLELDGAQMKSQMAPREGRAS